MKWYVVMLIIWNVVLFIYGVAVTIVMGKENQELDFKCAGQDRQLKIYKELVEEQRRKIADLATIVNDPHTRCVGFCEECKKATYSSFLKTYLCEDGTDKANRDYCSAFESRYPNV